MPYLSRIWMNPLRRRTQTFLRNPHTLHAAVLGGLSRQPIDERILWRLGSDHAHRAELLVLTESTPSWEHLVEQAGWSAADEPQQLVRDYQPLLDRVTRGREFRFRLRANPVVSTRQPTKPSNAQQKQLAQERPRGVRVPHRTAEQQLAWLTERVERWGFELVETPDLGPAVRLVERERLIFSKRSDVASHRVVLSTATFDGILRVGEPGLARDRLLSGVGSGRAYGCGLITLAPVSGEGS